jgi:hypothetical protein
MIEQGQECKTWQELADALGVNRVSVGNWRVDLRYKDNCPTSKDLREWQRWMKLQGLVARHAEVEDESKPRTIAEWKIEREKITCATLELKLRQAEGKLLVAAGLEVAVGQLLAGVATALGHFAGANARFLVGIKDPHTMQERLGDAINSVLLRIHAADYMHAEAVQAACDSVEDTEDRKGMEKCVMQAIRNIGATAIEMAMREQKSQTEGPEAETEADGEE